MRTSSIAPNQQPAQTDKTAAWAQVSRSLAAALKSGGDLSIRLTPEALGAVSISMRSEDAGFIVTLTAVDADAAQVLREGVDDLRKSLAEKGVEVVRIDVRTGAASTDAPGADGHRGAGAFTHDQGRGPQDPSHQQRAPYSDTARNQSESAAGAENVDVLSGTPLANVFPLIHAGLARLDAVA